MEKLLLITQRVWKSNAGESENHLRYKVEDLSVIQNTIASHWKSDRLSIAPDVGRITHEGDDQERMLYAIVANGKDTTAHSALTKRCLKF